MTPKEKKHWIIGGAVVVGAGALLFAAREGSGSSARGRSSPSGRMQPQPKQQYEPNPANAAIAQSWLQAKTQLGAGQQAGETQAFQAEIAKLISFNQTAAQTKQVSLQTAAEQAIAQSEAAAQEQIAQTQASAAQSVAQSQQPQWWQYLLGSLGSIGGLLGFNNPSAVPAGQGYAEIPGGWSTSVVDALDPLVYGLDNVAWGTPSNFVPQNWDNAIPWPTTIGGP